ncbi:hypothetical protein JCM11641_003676 [Rhodosporidiobolus odoratus]
MLAVRRGGFQAAKRTAASLRRTAVLVPSRSIRLPAFLPSFLSRLVEPAASSSSRTRIRTTEGLSDDAFSRLPLLEQYRHAMHLPVPTSAPKLNEPRLEALLFGGREMLKYPEAEHHAFSSAYHPERLEFVGDRLWHDVISHVLFILAPIEQVKPPTRPAIWRAVAELQTLSTNEMAAKLAAEFDFIPERTAFRPEKPGADIWEAYLAALEISNGRRALLEFLVPIVRREYFNHPYRRFDALPSLQIDGGVRQQDISSLPVLLHIADRSPPTAPPTASSAAVSSSDCSSSSATSTPHHPAPDLPGNPSPPSAVEASIASINLDSVDSTWRPMRYDSLEHAASHLQHDLAIARCPVTFMVAVGRPVEGKPRTFGTGINPSLAWRSIAGKFVKDKRVVEIDEDAEESTTSFPLRYRKLDLHRVGRDLESLVPYFSEQDDGLDWSIAVEPSPLKKVLAHGDQETYSRSWEIFVEKCYRAGVIYPSDPPFAAAKSTGSAVASSEILPHPAYLKFRSPGEASRYLVQALEEAKFTSSYKRKGKDVLLDVKEWGTPLQSRSSGTTQGVRGRVNLIKLCIARGFIVIDPSLPPFPSRVKATPVAASSVDTTAYIPSSEASALPPKASTSTSTPSSPGDSSVSAISLPMDAAQREAEIPSSSFDVHASAPVQPPLSIPSLAAAGSEPSDGPNVAAAEITLPRQSSASSATPVSATHDTPTTPSDSSSSPSLASSADVRNATSSTPPEDAPVLDSAPSDVVNVPHPWIFRSRWEAIPKFSGELEAAGLSSALTISLSIQPPHRSKLFTGSGTSRLQAWRSIAKLLVEDGKSIEVIPSRAGWKNTRFPLHYGSVHLDAIARDLDRILPVHAQHHPAHLTWKIELRLPGHVPILLAGDGSSWVSSYSRLIKRCQDQGIIEIRRRASTSPPTTTPEATAASSSAESSPMPTTDASPTAAPASDTALDAAVSPSPAPGPSSPDETASSASPANYLEMIEALHAEASMRGTQGKGDTVRTAQEELALQQSLPNNEAFEEVEVEDFGSASSESTEASLPPAEADRPVPVSSAVPTPVDLSSPVHSLRPATSNTSPSSLDTGAPVSQTIELVGMMHARLVEEKRVEEGGFEEVDKAGPAEGAAVSETENATEKQ